MKAFLAACVAIAAITLGATAVLTGAVDLSSASVYAPTMGGSIDL